VSRLAVCEERYVEIVKLLLDCGARQDVGEKTPIQCAERAYTSGIEELLSRKEKVITLLKQYASQPSPEAKKPQQPKL